MGTLALGSAGGFAITARIGLASLGFGGGAAAAGNAFVEGGGCFTEGTSIQMADGTTRPIEQIQAGDLVMSRSQSAGPNGAIEGKHVLRAYHLRVGHTVLLTLSSGEVLETTENHPFFVYGAGWVKAGKLSIGNLLVPRAGPTASAVTVTGIVRKAGPTTVYNFIVEDDHSYFVGTTEGGTWVHNGPGDCIEGWTTEIKDAATAAFRDNSMLSNMSDEAREIAAQYYESWVGNTLGQYQELTSLYNQARADFLRGIIDNIAGSAPDFARQNGLMHLWAPGRE